jgi:hypothetical protein
MRGLRVSTTFLSRSAKYSACMGTFMRKFAAIMPRHRWTSLPAFNTYRKNPQCGRTVWGKICDFDKEEHQHRRSAGTYICCTCICEGLRKAGRQSTTLLGWSAWCWPLTFDDVDLQNMECCSSLTPNAANICISGYQARGPFTNLLYIH